MLTPTFTFLLVVGFAFGNPDGKAINDETDLVKRIKVPHCVLAPDAPNCEKRLIAFNPYCLSEVWNPDCEMGFNGDVALAKRVIDYCKIHTCITHSKRASTEFSYCINHPTSVFCPQGKIKLRAEIKRDMTRYCWLHPEYPLCPKAKRSSGDDLTIAHVPVCVLQPDSPSCQKRFVEFDPNCLVDFYFPYCPTDFKKGVYTAKRVTDYCKYHACITEKKRDNTERSLSERSYGNPLPDFMCKLLQDDKLCSYYRKKNVREIMSSLCQAMPNDPACKNWRKRDDSWMLLEIICEENPFDYRCQDKWW